MIIMRTRVITENINHLFKALKLQQPLTLDDLESIAGLLGVKIIKADLNNCKGFTIYENHLHHIIINKNLSYQVARFTVAHELGHIILGHCRQPVNSVSPDIINVLEAEADIFAARLLRLNFTYNAGTENG